MRQKQVEITLGPDGTVSLDGLGFTDDSCTQSLDDVMKMLEAEEKKHVKRKPEFYRRAQRAGGTKQHLHSS